VVAIGGLVSALLSGRADAIFGGSWNVEGIELESRGAEPVITRIQDLGIPDYEELVMVARSDLVADDPRLIRDFMSAVADLVAWMNGQGLTRAEPPVQGMLTNHFLAAP
jgi:ABC-type nitrate/sulfonate/bicarbonate transport system substrate-binding protein